jgi:hypothetical protein
LVLAGSTAALAQAETLSLGHEHSSMVFARLDRPAKVVTISAPPPYPACAAANLFAPISRRSDAAGMVAMIAAVEAIKLLFDSSEPRSSIIEFASYENPARVPPR